MRLNLNPKNALAGIAVVIVLIVAVVWFMNNGIEHIEDTNGADNFELQQITDENIIKDDLGAVGGPKISRPVLLGDTVEFSAKKFTGVYEILYDNYIMPSDFELNLTGYEISGGNFKMVVVHDDKIVATLEPDLFVNYRLEDVKGTVSLMIAGESASFSFSMSEMEYDGHAHPDY